MSEPDSAAASRELMALFERWLDASATDRAALLAQVTTQQPELLPRLRAMIAADQSAESHDLLGDNNPLAAAYSPNHAGARLGAWALHEPIGAGGMAQVWLATRGDGLYSGRAAIKLLHGTRSGALANARFAQEGEFLARLVHPHIAQLLDAGLLDDGTRYLVLEYVQGERLDHWCDARRLGIEARLKLFAQVCEAVSYAHAHLVVHRDLKPGNILVTEEGHVKLLDFGVAKLLGDDAAAAAESELTRAGSAGLTPEYAAPEQVNGAPITTATDVYALGVLLYGLLSGGRPYGGSPSTPAQLARAIVETEPRLLGATEPAADAAATRSSTPARLRQALRGDLAQIVAHALRKAPEERYASVQALADDLGRHLRHEPVSAQPPGWRYRASKFLRRNRVPVGAAAVVVLAVGAGSGAALWQAREAQQQAARAEGVKNFLTGLLADSNIDARGQVVLDMTVSDLLVAAEGRVQTGLSGQPEVRDEVYALLENLQSAQGQLQRATAIAEARVAAAEAAFGRDDARLAPSLVALASTLLNARRDTPLAQQALARAERLLDAAGDQTSITRAQLWMWMGHAQLVASESNRKENGALQRPWQGNPASRAVDLVRARHPGTVEHLGALQMATTLAASVYQRHDVALAYAEEMVAVARKIYGAQHGNVARAMYVRGVALLGLKRHGEAYDTLAATRELQLKIYGESDRSLVATVSRMSVARLGEGRMGEARALAEEARALATRHHADNARVRAGIEQLDRRIAEQAGLDSAAPAAVR